MRAFILRALVLLVAVGAAACEGDINRIPTTPDPVTITETFTGTLTINGAQTHNVFTGATGLVSATITSLGEVETAPAKVGFSMGTLSSVGTCTVIVHNDNAVVTSALTGTVANLSGTLCVRIFDVGALTAPVDYTMTVSHP
jgi:hypothetical protein